MKIKYLPCRVLLALVWATSSLCAQNPTGVHLQIKALLQGALIKNNFSYDTLMRDDLRAKGYLPYTEPYSNLANFQHLNGGGNETLTDSTVFQITGENAIVDWVFVELRTPAEIDSTFATRSALLTRSGSVVDLDGVSPVHFSTVAPGDYFVIVRHRNHLGVMSGEPVPLSENSPLVDFTDPVFQTNGYRAQASLDNKNALRGGDLDHNGRMIYQGPGSDVLKLFQSVVGAPGNVNQTAFFVLSDYHTADTNMDGNAIYSGPGNDRTFLFIIFIIGIQDFNLSSCDNCYFILEQLP